MVARAYLDQLNRSKAIPDARASAISSTLDRADRIRSSDRGAAPAAAELVTLAGELERDAATATGRDQSRMRAMAETLKGRAAQLR